MRVSLDKVCEKIEELGDLSMAELRSRVVGARMPKAKRGELLSILIKYAPEFREEYTEQDCSDILTTILHVIRVAGVELNETQKSLIKEKLSQLVVKKEAVNV